MAQNLRQIVDSRQALEAEGTSEGAKKGWETRRGGGVAQDERKEGGAAGSPGRRVSDSERQRRRKLGQDFPAHRGVERRKAERRGTSGEKIYSPGGKSRYMSKQERDRINEEHLKSND